MRKKTKEYKRAYKKQTYQKTPRQNYRNGFQSKFFYWPTVNEPVVLLILLLCWRVGCSLLSIFFLFLFFFWILHKVYKFGGSRLGFQPSTLVWSFGRCLKLIMELAFASLIGVINYETILLTLLSLTVVIAGYCYFWDLWYCARAGKESYMSEVPFVTILNLFSWWILGITILFHFKITWTDYLV